MFAFVHPYLSRADSSDPRDARRLSEKGAGRRRALALPGLAVAGAVVRALDVLEDVAVHDVLDDALGHVPGVAGERRRAPKVVDLRVPEVRPVRVDGRGGPLVEPHDVRRLESTAWR